MKLASIAAPHFNLSLTLESGQVFHWHPIGGGWVGTIGTLPVYVEQAGKSLRVTAGMEPLVREYFALDHALPEIYATFPKDLDMVRALSFCAWNYSHATTYMGMPCDIYYIIYETSRPYPSDVAGDPENLR